MKTINGFVIKTIEFGDYDEIITFFSKEYGKLGIYCPGVRKIASKNKYSVDLFAQSTLEIFKSKRNKLSKLKTGVLNEQHRNIANNYNNYIYASVVMDTTDMIFKENEKSYSFYKLLDWTINNLNDNIFPLKTLTIFLFLSLKSTNAMWNLRKCVIDNKRIVNPSIFDFENYGLVHESDIENIKNTNYLIYDKKLVNSLLEMESSSMDKLNELNLDIDSSIILIKILLTYYEKVLGIWSPAFYELKKLPFLN